MARQRARTPVNHNLQDSTVSEEFFSDAIPEEIHGNFPEKQVEDRPKFIAKMPNLEEPRSIRAVFASQSVWNRLVEMKNGITDRQQILTLRCVVVLLVCMLFWSVTSKRSPDSPDFTQAESTLMDLFPAEEPYRSERSALPRSEGTYERLSFSSSARTVRELDNDELLPTFSTTSIDLSQTIELTEEPSLAFESQQRSTVPSSSAWDREDAYSISVAAPAVPATAWNTQAASVNDSTPDFSAFAAPNYGTNNAPMMNRYNEPQVRQVQYHQPAAVPGYGEQSAPLYSQRNPQVPANTQPGASPYATSQPAPYGQQYPVAVQNQSPYQQPYNPANNREEIPATFTNNTYRNPGTPQANPQATAPQGYYGQYNPQQPVNQQYNQSQYGNAVFPANTLNR